MVSCPPPEYTRYTCACASYYILATRMATYHGTVGEYDSEREQWLAYAERLEFYFAANDVNSPEKQRAVLLSSCGPSTFQLIRNLVAPDKPSSKSFAELVDLVKAHYNPKPSAIVSHFKFYSCVRNHGETVAAFVARLRQLTEHCNYGATLEEMLRDRIVGGIDDERLQRRMLAELDLTFQKALDLAQAYESAAKNAKDLQASKPPGDVHAVSDRPPAGGADREARIGNCYRCGGQHHQSTCGFRNADCLYCGKRGHISKVCRTRLKRAPGKNQPGAGGGKFQTAHQMQTDEDTGVPETEALAYTLYAVTTNVIIPYYTVHVNQVYCSDSPIRLQLHFIVEVPRRKSVIATRLVNNLLGNGIDYKIARQLSYFQLSVKTVFDKSAPINATVLVNKAELCMEVDTGASLSLISETTHSELQKLTQLPTLSPSTIKLRTYSGEELEVLGQMTVNVGYQTQLHRLSLVVVRGSGPSLLGHDWLRKLKLDWGQLHLLRSMTTTPLKEILGRHAAVFRDELGTISGETAKIYADPTVQPRFYEPRSIPYALHARVEAELERLENEGIIKPVRSSEWAAPIVPVVKRDGSIRVCGDYKLTANKAAIVDSYPMPRVEDLFASLAGGQAFSKLDLAHAYLQLQLDDTSKPLLAINTSKGLYQYQCLPFGVASAPAIFQRTMESILQGLPHICVYLDDILVTGRTEQEHLHNLEAALTRLEQAGIHLKREKCAFMLPEVEYLGHRLSAEGLRPTTGKVQAIIDTPAPRNVSQHRSFLGLINYYGKFLSNLSTLLAPLHHLLMKHTKWAWADAQEKAFQEVKKQLTSSPLLAHYDPKKEVILSCDASPYGIGAVLSHIMEDGTEHPIAFASRSLSVAEKNYSQLEREGLSIVFGVKKFHPYLFGRTFTILSDHQPLKHLFGESRAIPPLASARIQRWALTLSAYQYKIAYKPGVCHANADVLSRLPLLEAPTNVPIPGETVLLMESLEVLPLTAVQIARWTDRNPVLTKVRDNVQRGWQHSDEAVLHPYQSRRMELSVEDGCVLWGRRVAVPPQGRARALVLLHEGHPVHRE